MDDALQPIDLLVALKVAVDAPAVRSVRDLEEELGLSKSAVSTSLRRLRGLGLVREGEEGRRVPKRMLLECVEHVARWIAPATVGDYELGLPTAHSEASVRAQLLGAEADTLVIPLPHGPVRGRAVSPIHPLAPAAAARDPRLHRMLALVDTFRVGRARERAIAARELRACLAGDS